MLYRKDEAPIMNSKPDISLLYDFYAELLNDSQRRVVELYVNEDLSLSEVAEILHISRQGVRDSIKRAEAQLEEMEEKLAFVKKFRELRSGLDEISEAAAEPDPFQQQIAHA